MIRLWIGWSGCRLRLRFGYIICLFFMGLSLCWNGSFTLCLICTFLDTLLSAGCIDLCVNKKISKRTVHKSLKCSSLWQGSNYVFLVFLIKLVCSTAKPFWFAEPSSGVCFLPDLQHSTCFWSNNSLKKPLANVRNVAFEIMKSKNHAELWI